MWEEHWDKSDRAYVSYDVDVGGDQYLSIKGSFLSDRSGPYEWLLSCPIDTLSYNYLWIDGEAKTCSPQGLMNEDGQRVYSCALEMTSGYRYSFYLTTPAGLSSGYIWLALYDSDSNTREYFGKENCEQCNVSGCVDLIFGRNSCPTISLRSTGLPWDTRTPAPSGSISPIPIPSISVSPNEMPTPVGCSVPGVYVSKHSNIWDEQWIKTERAYVSYDLGAGGDQYLSIKGSFLSDRSGSYEWLLSCPIIALSYSYFWIDDEPRLFVQHEDEDEQRIYSFSLDMVSGYRYSFYLTTSSHISSGYMWLALYDSHSKTREYFGKANCEQCNVSGCTDLTFDRISCPTINLRATGLPWETRSPTGSVDAVPGAAESSSASNTAVIVLAVIVVVLVAAGICVGIVWYVRHKGGASISDGEAGNDTGKEDHGLTKKDADSRDAKGQKDSPNGQSKEHGEEAKHEAVDGQLYHDFEASAQLGPNLGEDPFI
jgi:hypothetical protein